MGFNIDTDFSIFEPIFQRRPTINKEEFKADLKDHYLPFLDQLLKLKRPAIVGLSAIQGAGKTTLGEILEVLLLKEGLNSISLSIDDHYITHKELCDLREKDPRFIRRGVTHDIPLALRNLNDLVTMHDGEIVVSPEYDKGAQKGDGDRFRWINPEQELTLKGVVSEQVLCVNKEMQKVRAFKLTAAKFGDKLIELPENMGSLIPVMEEFLPKSLVTFLEGNQDMAITVFSDTSGMVHFVADGEITVDRKTLPKGWRVVSKKPDFVVYDGWMLGARSVADESVFASGLPALETPEDQEFARFINRKLVDYNDLWSILDYLTVLYVPHYEMALTWREDAEKPLQAEGKGMTPEQIKEFVYYFWRSVHPAVQIKNLAHDQEHTNLVMVIGDDHTVREALIPAEISKENI